MVKQMIKRVRGRRYLEAIGIVSLLLLCWMLYHFLDVFVFGIFIYYITNPIYWRINKRLEHKSISAFISLFLLVLPIILVGFYALSIASMQFSNLLESAHYSITTRYVEGMLNQLADIARDIKLEDIPDLFQRNASLQDIIMIPITLAVDIIFKLFLMFTIAYYLLKDGYKLRRWVVESTMGKENELTHRFLDAVDGSFHRVFFGSIVTAFVTAILASIVFNLLNMVASATLQIPYPVLMGTFCGIATLVPGIGIKTLWVPLGLYLGIVAYLNGILFAEGWFLILFFLVVNFIVDFTPDILLRPHISGKDVHPGIILLSFIFGPLVFGIKGIFLGPIIVIVVTEFMAIVLPKIRH